jgi:hypothetical protein
VAPEPAWEDTSTNASTTNNREYGAVLSSRVKTGFGGMITVTAILMAVQLISGVKAFPL